MVLGRAATGAGASESETGKEEAAGSEPSKSVAGDVSPSYIG
jgi:hypothetical protein